MVSKKHLNKKSVMVILSLAQMSWAYFLGNVMKNRIINNFIDLDSKKITGCIILLIALLLISSRAIWGTHNDIVKSNSAVPTLLAGDRYFSNRNLSKLDINESNYTDYLQRGLYYGVYNPLGESVGDAHSGKRIIGLPNDTVEIKNGIVFVNGNRITKEVVDTIDGYIYMREEVDGNSYYVRFHRDAHPNMRKFTRNGKWVVPSNSVFVMGDNRDESGDSRLHGVNNGNFSFIKLNDVNGQDLFVRMSLSNLQQLTLTRIGCPLSSTDDYMPYDQTCWLRDDSPSHLKSILRQFSGQLN